MLAIFDNLGFSELLIVVVVAVLVFGKRLPEVAAQAGAQIGKFRRSLQDIKTETGIDTDLRNIQRDIQNAIPRDLSMGEMARIASAELEKRMKANDQPKTLEASRSDATGGPTADSSVKKHSAATDALPAQIAASTGSHETPADLHAGELPASSGARESVANLPSHESPANLSSRDSTANPTSRESNGGTGPKR